MNRREVACLIQKVLDGNAIDNELQNELSVSDHISDGMIHNALHEIQHFQADLDLRMSDPEYEKRAREGLYRAIQDLNA